MPVFDTILNLAKTQAEISNMNMLTGLHAQQIQQYQLLNDQAQKSRMIAREYDAQVAAQQAGAPGQPGQQAAGLGDANGGVEANPQLQAVSTMYQQAQKDYLYHKGMANALRAKGGKLDLAEKYDDNARQARQDMAAAQLRLLQQRKEMLQEVGGLAGTADENNFPQVRARMDYLQPGWDRGQDVDFSPLDGRVTWGPRTAKVLTTIGNGAMTRHQQVDASLRQQTIDNTTEHDADLADEYASRDAARKARDVAARDNIDLKERRLDDQEDGTIGGRRTTAGTKAAKAAVPKEPTATEVKETAANFANEDGLTDLSDADRKVASRDFLRYRNQVQAKNPDMDPQQADNEAMAFVKTRIKPGADGQQTWSWYNPFHWGEPTKVGATKPGYSKTGNGAAPGKGATATPSQTQGDDALGTKLAAVGLSGDKGVRVQDGKVTTDGGGPVPIANDDQYNLLPSGTVFIGPDGKKRTKP
jgi:hypothetical protein